MPNTVVKLFSANGSWGLPPARVGRCQAKFYLFHSSSVVELSAVNRSVVGSSPTCGANTESCPSWPKEHDWKSCRRRKTVSRVRIPRSPPESFFKKWPVGQAVKTPPFHGGITGSIPVRVTIFSKISMED